MSRKDVTDHAVCMAYRDRKEGALPEWPYELLMRRTGEPEKVCYSAMERAYAHGLIDYGVSLRSGWLTETGEQVAAGGLSKK